jgi:hypothetical protein
VVHVGRSKFWLSWGGVFAYYAALDQLPVWYGKFGVAGQITTPLIGVLLWAVIIASRVHDAGRGRAWMTGVLFPPLALPLGFMRSDPAAAKVNVRFSIFACLVASAATAVVIWWLGTVAVSYALLNHACSSGAAAACESLAHFQFVY